MNEGIEASRGINVDLRDRAVEEVLERTGIAPKHFQMKHLGHFRKNNGIHLVGPLACGEVRSSRFSFRLLLLLLFLT